MTVLAGVRWSLQSAAGVPGAVGVIQLRGPTAGSIEAAIRRLGMALLPVGGVGLRSLAGVDTGLVARFDERTAHLFPHGGVAVVRRLAGAITEAGIAEETRPGNDAWPETEDLVERRMLGALSAAASPLAIDLLLDQPRLWAGGGGRDPSGPRTPEEAARDRILRRLIEPSLVVAVGPPNVGKSSLVNTLAGRAVALVADRPGTTRDHVGVLLDLSGLVVRYIDSPGLRTTDDPIELEAQRLALLAVRGADLVLACSDAAAGPPPDFENVGERLTVATRADLGLPAWQYDLAVSAATASGVPELVRAIRDRLVPLSLIADGGPWKFW